jgi:rhodanese-related sulfurtransferase
MPIVIRVVTIVLGGALLGLGWNAWSGRGFDLRAHALVRPGDVDIEPKDAKALLDKNALFIDARPRAFYEMSHIPGALPMPEDEDFETTFAQLEPRLRAAPDDVIVYCSGFGCPAAHELSRKLKARGVPAIILKEGWPAWTDAGLPTKEGREP